MFENISQGIVTTGSIVYLVIVPILRLVAIVFMVLSTYKLLKARQDGHKFLWILAVLFSPLLGRCAYEVYRRWIAEKDMPAVRGSTPLCIISIVAFALSAVLTVVSIISIGIGFVKSEIDGEPLAVFYDVHGNEYDDLYDVPLYDREGNTYTYEAAWFAAGNYIDQDGNTYDGTYCYLSEDGHFYYDANDELQPCDWSDDYYTDGETIFYYLFNCVYWEEDGTIYQASGRLHLELFDFDEELVPDPART